MLTIFEVKKLAAIGHYAFKRGKLTANMIRCLHDSYWIRYWGLQKLLTFKSLVKERGPIMLIDVETSYAVMMHRYRY